MITTPFESLSQCTSLFFLLEPYVFEKPLRFGSSKRSFKVHSIRNRISEVDSFCFQTNLPQSAKDNTNIVPCTQNETLIKYPDQSYCFEPVSPPSALSTSNK